MVVAGYTDQFGARADRSKCKLQCIAYAPFRVNQTSLSAATQVSREQIAEDLAELAKVTDCIRTYATDLGLDRAGNCSQGGAEGDAGNLAREGPEKNATQIAAGNASPSNIRKPSSRSGSATR